MFSIYDGRSEFYQWDVNRKLIVEDSTIKEVHFCNRSDDCSLVVDTYTDSGLTLADVPNVLLQQDRRIYVYAYDGEHTKHSTLYNVNWRTRPADYAYTETEVRTWDALQESLNNAIGRIEEDNENTREELEETASKAVDIANKAESIAKGKATGYVFNTLADMRLWLADEANTKKLSLGDNLYIKALSVPDYWWDGNAAQQLETQKVDLTGYAKTTDLSNYVKTTDLTAERWTFELSDGTFVTKDVVVE